MQDGHDDDAGAIEVDEEATGRAVMELTAWLSAEEMVAVLSAHGTGLSPGGAAKPPLRPNCRPQPRSLPRRPRPLAGPATSQDQGAPGARTGRAGLGDGALMPGLVDIATLYLLAQSGH